MTVDLELIHRAASRLAPHIPVSPLVPIPGIGLWLKNEAGLPTGSFKVRGALNRLLADPARSTQHVVAASAGNHGLGVAYASRKLGLRATIVVPAGAVAVKIEGIRRLGAEIVEVQGGYVQAEAHGHSIAEQRGSIWVSPYNDPEVIAGQGVIGLELFRQMGGVGARPLDEVYVPVGGGGLVAGIGIVLKSYWPTTRLVGVQPAASPFMAVEFGGGDRASVVEGPTVADGLAGDVEAGSITIPLAKQVVDAFILVDERSILEAISWVWHKAALRIEPSAAAAVAAYLAFGQGRCAVVLSGGNADPALLARCGVPDAG